MVNFLPILTMIWSYESINSTDYLLDGKKVGDFLITIQISFKLIINHSWI